MDKTDNNVPDLQFSKSEILKKVAEHLSSFNDKKLGKNAELAQTLRSLTEDDIDIRCLHAVVQIGRLDINCTAEGFRKYDDGSYVRRTMNDTVSSTPHVFLISGNEEPAILAERHYGYSSFEASAFTLRDIGIRYAANVAKRVSIDYCDQQFSALNMKMQSCRVNNYDFVPSSERFDYYSWKIYTKVKDKKGELSDYLLGSIKPTDSAQDKQELSVYFDLKTPKNKKSSQKKKLALYILCAVLLVASIATSAIIYYSNGGSILNMLPTLVPAIIAFALSKYVFNTALSIFFTIASLALIVATVALAVAFIIV